MQAAHGSRRALRALLTMRWSKPCKQARDQAVVARITGPTPRIYRRVPLYFPVNTGDLQAIYRWSAPHPAVRHETQGPATFRKKRPRGFPAAAIPTVDFLLHHRAAAVKKTAVKTHHRC